MELTVEQLAATIDHAVLKPDFTIDDIRTHAVMCMERGVASMCVRPFDVALAAELLDESDVLVSCVLSFPHGADTSAIKALQAEQAVADGVDEIDMVMNIGQFLSGSYDAVRDDIRAVVDVAHSAGVIVKVIQESCYLTLDQVAKACELSLEAQADFVKTSTGFGPGVATPEVIEVMVKTVGGQMGVKASGGIRSWDAAVAFLKQGASRLGIGSTEAVLDGRTATGSY